MGLGLAPEIYASGTHKSSHEPHHLKKKSKPETSDTELVRLTTGNGGYISSVGHPESKTPSLEEESQHIEIRRNIHFRISHENSQGSAYQTDISR